MTSIDANLHLLLSESDSDVEVLDPNLDILLRCRSCRILPGLRFELHASVKGYTCIPLVRTGLLP